MKRFVILAVATFVSGGCSLTRSGPTTAPATVQAPWRVVRLDPDQQMPAAILINQATGESWKYVPGGNAWEKLSR